MAMMASMMKTRAVALRLRGSTAGSNSALTAFNNSSGRSLAVGWVNSFPSFPELECMCIIWKNPPAAVWFHIPSAYSLETHMLTRLQTTFFRFATGRTALLATLIFAAFMAFVLPGQAEQAGAYTGEAGSPDQSFFYSADDIRIMAESYGPEGRQAYTRARFTFDLVFPFVYGFFFVALIGWGLSKWAEAGSRWRRLVFVPVLGMVFDFLENIAAATVMARFPAEAPVAAALAPVFSAVKWVFVGGSFPVLAGVMLGWLVSVFKPGGRSRQTD
jgi:hypothetical protein